MIKAAFLLIVIIAGLLQVTLLDYLSIFAVKPDLLLACVVIAVLSFEFKWALLFSVLTGLLKDAFTASGFGMNTFLFSLWGYLAIRLSGKITLEKYFLPSVLIFIIMVLNGITVKAISLSLANLAVPLGIFSRIVFLESLYTALVFPLVFKIVKYQLSLAAKYRERFLKNADEAH